MKFMIFGLLSISLIAEAQLSCASLLDMRAGADQQSYLKPNSYFETERGNLLYYNRILENGLRAEVTEPANNFLIKNEDGQNSETPTQPLSRKLSPSGEVVDFLYPIIEKQSTFLQTFYPRRKWDSSFSEKAANAQQLLSNAFRSKRSVVYDPDGNIIASGSLIFSPYLILEDTSNLLAEKIILPWMSAQDLSAFLERGADLSSVDWSHIELPVEKFFGKRFPRGVGVQQDNITLNDGRSLKVSIGSLVEVGSFAVDHKSEFREAAIAELYYDFLMGIYSTPYTINSGEDANLKVQMLSSKITDRIFYSYGDMVGQRMYRPYGFEAIDGVSLSEHDVLWSPFFANKTMLKAFGKSKELMSVVERVAIDLHLKYQSMETGIKSHSERSDLKATYDLVANQSYARYFFLTHN